MEAHMGTGATTTILAGTTAIGAALTAGVFFGFSWLVMPALDKVAQAGAIAAMQEINRIAVRCALMPLMFGTALLCVAAAVACLRADRTIAAIGIAAAAIYLIGVIGVTICANVPLNDQLARLSAAAAAPDAWQAYSAPWTQWNTVRAVAGAIASGCFTTMVHLLGRAAS
jgi:uncharacterized membrane protein